MILNEYNILLVLYVRITFIAKEYILKKKKNKRRYFHGVSQPKFSFIDLSDIL